MNNNLVPDMITIITGPMRSGTSCTTGLLETFGFNLGGNIRILRDKTESNPMGHFEPDLLYTINLRLLEEVPDGDWGLLNIPGVKEMDRLAMERERYFRLFIDKFDGELCKDPLLCLTLPYWERHWPSLTKAIFCLRNPLSVASSMQKRYGISLEQGFNLWKTYTSRFFNARIRSVVYILDFDLFLRSPVETMHSLLVWLGKPSNRDNIERIIESFVSSKYVHWTFSDEEMARIPAEIDELYRRIRSSAARQQTGVCMTPRS